MNSLFGLVITILLVFIILALAQKAFKSRNRIPYYRPIRDKFKKKKGGVEEEPVARMFVAIRRNPNGRADMMKLDENEYNAQKAHVMAQMDQLVRQWSTLATFKWGFHKSEYGLPSSNNESWMLFASFVVPKHETYRQCIDILQSEAFLRLRQQCDIQLLYGEKMENLTQHTGELFRLGFSR